MRSVLITTAALLVGVASSSVDAQEGLDAIEPQSLIEFGGSWAYFDGSVQLGPHRARDVVASELEADGWLTGPAPFIGRDQAVHDQIRAEQRRLDRRRRRHGRRVTRPAFTGSLLLYDATAYEAPTEPPSDYAAGPNTYYFARTFTVEDVADVASLFVEVRFSGGFVAYLNGHELARHNVDPGRSVDEPADIVWQPEWVSQLVANVWQRAFTGLDPSGLREGENLLVFEVHRRGSGGPRALYFDAQVRAYRQVGLVRTPYLQSVTTDGVTIMWETTTPAIGYVEYGSGEWLDRVATSPRVASTTHEVRLTSLSPDTRYFYRVHSLSVDDRDRWPSRVSSAVYHFRTAVDPGTPFTFVAYGDSRTNSSIHARLIRRMLEVAERNQARFFLNTGDLTTHASWWDEWQAEFFLPALPMMAYFPIYTVLGNHEGNHETYYELLDMPGNEAWYSFVSGDAEFFAIDSNIAVDPGSPQYEWLDDALANSDASWKIAFLHHPPFSCIGIRKPGNELVREHLVPLFERYGVDLVLLGHDHLYGRSVPLGGVVYVITGGGGASTYPAEPDEVNPICIQVHHYCLIRVSESTLELEAVTIDGELLDRFTLTH